MAKGELNFEHLKSEQVTMADRVWTRDTDVLDGAAEDSAVMDENNETTQYRTPPLPDKDLGGRNDPEG